MSSIPPEKWHFIPINLRVGDLIDPYGGRTVESYKGDGMGQEKTTKGSNEISWQQITSRGEAIFTLIQEGLKANFLDWGLGVKYDDKGELTAIRIELLTFLSSLLNVADENGDFNENLSDLEDLMGDCDEEFVAHLNLVSGKYAIYAHDSKINKDSVLSTGVIESYKQPVLLLVTYKGFSFTLFLGDSEDQLRLGIGVLDRVDDELSPVGTLPNGTEQNVMQSSFLSMFLLKGCNYMTYLDSKRFDRFDKLAERIILG